MSDHPLKRWYFGVYTDPKSKEKYSAACNDGTFRHLRRKPTEEDILRRLVGMIETTYELIIGDYETLEVYKCEDHKVSEIMKLISETRRINPFHNVDYCIQINSLETIIKKSVVKPMIAQKLLVDYNPLDWTSKNLAMIDEFYNDDGDEIWSQYKASEGLL
jgi:hypothetical protein